MHWASHSGSQPARALKDRIDGSKTTRDQARADAERASALPVRSAQQATTPTMLRVRFDRAAPYPTEGRRLQARSSLCARAAGGVPTVVRIGGAGGCRSLDVSCCNYCNKGKTFVSDPTIAPTDRKKIRRRPLACDADVTTALLGIAEETNAPQRRSGSLTAPPICGSASLRRVDPSRAASLRPRVLCALDSR